MLRPKPVIQQGGLPRGDTHRISQRSSSSRPDSGSGGFQRGPGAVHAISCVLANEAQSETNPHCGFGAGASCDSSGLRAAWLDGAGFIKGFLRGFVCSTATWEDCALFTLPAEASSIAAGNSAARGVDREIAVRG